jgi:hypothetical protein
MQVIGIEAPEAALDANKGSTAHSARPACCPHDLTSRLCTPRRAGGASRSCDPGRPAAGPGALHAKNPVPERISLRGIRPAPNETRRSYQ